MRTIISIALGAALGAGGFALAQHDKHDKHGSGTKVKSLLERDVSEKIDGKDARVSIVEVSMSPGGSTPPHRHPGAVFGHVLEGEFETQLEGQPLQKLKTGDTFYEPTMALHAVSRNPSQTGNTRVLAVILHPRDAKELVLIETPKGAK
ncbi:cupin domain-containing protein [Schlesneria paludicola]|uniref:cupin domain-containing protein n=1 Tax=Schlesneria paludicola TaxID=360056 RepID=UPI0002FF32D0|nr:cupin domain-containing protein [Schlesneria paludicola]